MPTHQYALQQLFVDQDPDLVTDTVAPVLAWQLGAGTSCLIQVEIERVAGAPASSENIELTWDIAALTAHRIDLAREVQRLATRRTALHEDLAKLAAYGLGFVAISVFLPGTRVQAFNFYAAPDLLYDTTPTGLKGVEVAGRSSGGRGALNTVRTGGQKPKQPELLARSDIAEVYLSLWSAQPLVSVFAKIKP